MTGSFSRSLPPLQLHPNDFIPITEIDAFYEEVTPPPSLFPSTRISGRSKIARREREKYMEDDKCSILWFRLSKLSLFKWLWNYSKFSKFSSKKFRNYWCFCFIKVWVLDTCHVVALKASITPHSVQVWLLFTLDEFVSKNCFRNCSFCDG